MAYPQGINFRATAGFVTDGTNEDHDISTTANYPTTTVQGNTVGWEQAPIAPRDRNAALDRRLAGLNGANSITDYRFDLPAPGNYRVRLASGDDNFPEDCLIDLRDGGSLLAHLANVVANPSHVWIDALNAGYSAANWPGNNSPLSVTFTTTICRFRVLATITGGSTTVIAHAYVESAAGPTGPPPQIVLIMP